MKVSQIIWKEPNRAQTPPLHIASRGQRFSTVTGVWWLDEFRFVANHRNGLRIALFDIRALERPLAICDIPHLTDDIAAKKTAENSWEIAVSGCWDAAYSLYQLTIADSIHLHRISTVPHRDKTFCHGVAYGKEGDLCLTFHTGSNPRIVIANTTWQLPEPWGARDLCYDPGSDKYYAVAVSQNPKRTAYDTANTSIWELDSVQSPWKKVKEISDMHADTCQIHQNRLWIPDQNADRVLGLCLNDTRPTVVVKAECLDFPHGLGISAHGILAVTSYGNSSITLIHLGQIQ